MSSLADVAEALADTLAATGLRVNAYIPESPNPPEIFLNLGPVERDAFVMGSMQVPFDAVLLVPTSSARIGQRLLYDHASFTGTKSVWKAVNDTPSLGLADTNAAVLRYRPLGIEEVAAYNFYGGVFEILVLTEGA